MHGDGRIWVIYLAASGCSVASVIADAVAKGLIGLIVPAEPVADAYGVMQTAGQALRVIVPLAGVACYARFGSAVVVVITVVSLLAGAAAVAAVRLRETKPEPTGRRWLDDVTIGVRQLAADRILSWLTIAGVPLMVEPAHTPSSVSRWSAKGLASPLTS